LSVIHKSHGDEISMGLFGFYFGRYTGLLQHELLRENPKDEEKERERKRRNRN